MKETKLIRVYNKDHDHVMNGLYKLMRKWKRGEPMPTVADVIHDLIEKGGGK